MRRRLIALVVLVAARGPLKRYAIPLINDLAFTWPRRWRFRRRPIPPGSTVMLGDSLTHWTRWNTRFPDVCIVNRGIAGDTSAGVLARVEEVVESHPERMLLMVGTNDLFFGVAPDRTVANIGDIVAAFGDRSPQTTVYIQSVLPRGRRSAAVVGAINRRLRQLAEETEATWIDLWPHFDDGRGGLRRDLSVDGLHLRGAGYDVWTRVLADEVPALAGARRARPRPGGSRGVKRPGPPRVTSRRRTGAHRDRTVPPPAH